MLLYGLLHLPGVQTWMAGKAASELSRQLGTEVALKGVDIHFFDKLDLKGLLIRDKKKDTLLYAGILSVKITDWFFLKKKYTLHYAGLEDGFINFYRKDSVWNYQFLADYFTDTSAPTGTRPSIGLEKAEIKRFRFMQKDAWVGQDLSISMQALDMNVDTLDLKNKKFSIASLRIAGPSFEQFEYAGNKPHVQSPPKKDIQDTARYQWNPEGWVITAGLVQLINGHLRIDKETEHLPYTDRFDGQHLEFNGLQGHLSDLRLSEDTVSMNMQLAGKEKSGLEVKKLEAKLRFSPVIMEFSDLDLMTNRSRLKNYYAMHYRSFIDDMNDFTDKVTLEGRFAGSDLSSEDLAFFDPQLKAWNRNFQFSGEATGTIESMKARKLVVRSGQSGFDGDLDLENMTDLDSLKLKINARDLSTRFNEIAGFAPALKNVKEIKGSRLGAIQFRGIWEGRLDQFTASGNISTALGSLQGDLSMSLPAGKTPSYEGKISTAGFRLGALTDNKQWGTIAFSGSIKGSGLDATSLNADIDLHADHAEISRYDYRNAGLKGHFGNGRFEGNLNMNDPNLNIPSLSGTLFYGGKETEADFSGDIAHADLRKLNLFNRDLNLSGLFDLHFSGSRPAEIEGTIRAKSLRLQSGLRSVHLDSLMLESGETEGRKYLSLRSEPLKADISGQFTIPELPKAFSHFLSRYYPSFIQASEDTLKDQHFTFSLKTGECSDLLSVLVPEASGLNYMTLDGDIDLLNNRVEMSGSVPDFSYDKNRFSRIQFLGSGNEDSLHMNFSIEDIALSDSLHFPGTKLDITTKNDISDIHLKTQASEALSDAELNARLQTFDNGISLNFSPSSFIINNKKWLLEKDGALTIRNNNIEARDIKFKEGFQEITLSTEKTAGESNPVLIANLKSVTIEDFAPLFITDPEIKGLMTGKAVIRQPLDAADIRFTGLADSFYLNKSKIGNIALGIHADLDKGTIDFSGNSENPDYRFSVTGRYDAKDSTGQYLDTRFTGEHIDLSALQPYLSSVFSSVTGTAHSDLRLTGEGKNTYLTGTVEVDSGTLEVAYTRCRYGINKQKIYFNRDEIEVRDLELKDAFGNSGTLKGIMRHHLFSDFSFDNIRMETPRLQLLNTTKDDNSDFYGKMIGRATMTLNGPLNNMKMTIDGAPSLSDSSHIYLPTGSTRESNTVDYIDFVEFGSLARVDAWSSNIANILLDMNIDANPACKVDVILDETTGDVITGTGQGLISLRAGNREPLTVRGRYELSSGEYTFNFQTFFKKPFTLNRGNIVWTGDPYEAMIDIDAEYLARNVNVSSILPTEGFRQREDIIILSHLKGNLTKPQITFEFKLPEKSELSRDYLAVKKLADIQNDENEMNKQVASLLLFNSFLTENQNFLSGQNTVAFAASTAGGIISNWLTNIFNKQLERATNGMLSTYIDINPTLSLQKNANELQANVRAGLRLLLSNRLVFLVGGTLDYNNPYFQLDQKGMLTPDITLEWLLNREGSVRVVGFHRSSIDFSMGQRNRSGAQLSYRKDFDRLSDIFKSRKKIEEDAVKSELREN